MAGTEVNLYGVGDVDLTALMNTTDLQRVGYMALSLTNFAADTLPAIAAGSLCEVGGTLFSFGIEEAITGWAAIADDTDAYIKLVPAGATPDTVTAEFTDTAPTWSDAKQGWYGTVASANHRYIGGLYRDDAASFDRKWLYDCTDTTIRAIKSQTASRMRVTKNNAQTIAAASAVIVQYDDEVFDNLNEFATFKFTAKETGYYFVTASLQSALDNWVARELWEIWLYKNNGFVSSGISQISSGAMASAQYVSKITDIIYLEATDFIDIRCNQTHTAAVNTSTSANYNYFAVHRLS